MPHPPNVRRRIRQLAEHQYTDSDWISYAIIDNITDAYAPLIEQIEQEVDDIDDQILRLHYSEEKKKAQKSGSKAGDPEKMSVKPDSPLEKSEDYMDAVNMYFVVFKGGVISVSDMLDPG